MATSNLLTKEVVVVNELGLHARPAARFARAAQAAGSPIWVIFGEEKADATSIMDVLALGCAQGTRLTLAAEDPADRPVLEALARLIETGFEE
ncbi:MAG: HPr family phosphocarrier protein [Desulfobacterales bacterium]